MKFNFFKWNVFAAIIIIITLFQSSFQQCNEENGCIRRDKFFVWSTTVGKNGQTSSEVNDTNFKVIYLLNNKISILDSIKPKEKVLEEEPSMGFGINTSRMNRIIPYDQIELACGFKNKLCLVGEYKNQERISNAVDVIRKNPDMNNIESNCIVISYFEAFYNNPNEKVTILCLPAPNDLFQVIAYREIISEIIEKVQMKTALNRNTSFNGIERPIHKVITYNSNKMGKFANLQVKYNKILLWTDDKKWSRDYSLYELKEVEGFASSIIKAKKSKPASVKNWNTGLKPQAEEDCCYLLDGVSQDLLFCVADSSGEMEKNTEICNSELKLINDEVHNFIYKIKFANAFIKINQDDERLNNCGSSYWKIFKISLQNAINHSLKNCKNFLINAGGQRKNTITKCKDSFNKDFDHQIVNITKNDTKFTKGFNKCILNPIKDQYTPEKIDEKIKALFSKSENSFFFKQIENLHDKEEELRDAYLGFK